MARSSANPVQRKFNQKREMYKQDRGILTDSLHKRRASVPGVYAGSAARRFLFRRHPIAWTCLSDFRKTILRNPQGWSREFTDSGLLLLWRPAPLPGDTHIRLFPALMDHRFFKQPSIAHYTHLTHVPENCAPISARRSSSPRICPRSIIAAQWPSQKRSPRTQYVNMVLI